MSKPVKLLIVSDAPTAPTGLGRITRELALRIHEDLSDHFEVATFGYGGTCSRKLPFMQYPITMLQNWQTPELPVVWRDFADQDKGVLLAIWNASWLPWLADSAVLPEGELRSFLDAKRFTRWGYFPIDSEGPNGLLQESQVKIMSGFDRLATYTDWGARLIDKSAAHYAEGDESRAAWKGWSTPSLPHGTDGAVFYPRDRKEARKNFISKVVRTSRGGISNDIFFIGVIATNTQRKDWPLAFETCQELTKRGVEVGLWVHTDAFRKNWDLLLLADSFGMRDRVIFTNGFLSDDELAWGYAACDVTLGIGAGEGWGLPISESLAMGIPCITGDYAGAAEFSPSGLKIKPKGFQYDGFYANKRPIFDAAEWAEAALDRSRPHSEPPLSRLGPQYYWESAWPVWKKWLLEGIE